MDNFLTTIFALATPPIKSALAIIRISGPLSHESIDKLINKPLDWTYNKIIPVTLKYQDKIIDQAMVVKFKEPHSFTGEDSVEIYLHGSLLIIKELTAIFMTLGLTPAGPGEFSKRAYFNNKLSLLQAESINELINAKSSLAKNNALKNLSGRTFASLDNIIETLTTLIAQINVNIDYPEYLDIHVLGNKEIIPAIEIIIKELTNIKSHSYIGRIINEGLKVAIIGKPNVGKSTILNALIKEDKAITSNIPGTTRDIVEGEVMLNGIPLHFLDTAGIRDTTEIIEKKGIDKSFNAIEESDIIIVVFDTDNLDSEDNIILEKTQNKKRIIVRNKADIYPPKNNNHLALSAISNNVQVLEKALLDLIKIDDYDFVNDEFLTNARQQGEIDKSLTHLQSALSALKNHISADLVLKEFELALLALLRLIGKDSSIDLEKEVFARFCIGK